MQYQDLLERFTAMSRRIFGDNLLGVYLHGSLAMGCFNPQKSDIDLLLAVEREPTDEEKLAFMQQVIAFNEEAPAKGLELSIVTRDAVNPFCYPTHFVLHFSPMHLDWFRRDPTGYVQHMKGEDPDLAAHCTVVRKCGKVLCGAPVEAFFGDVPTAAYLDSIRQDVAGAEEDIVTDPIYMTLNLCRVLAYAREGLVLSKQEGGQWGLSHLPEEHCPVIRQALDCYANDRSMQTDEAAARAFAVAMLESITSAAAHAG
ncbi:MAG: DUF4111 domain-containing protein [Clostridia bacterium]|nr:DUF4111 domain-containing protein [Clostridia bacterium]